MSADKFLLSICVYPRNQRLVFVPKSKSARNRALFAFWLSQLFLVFVLGPAAFGARRSLLFFHLFLEIFLALGAGFGALGAFGVDIFLAAHQFDEAGGRAVALAESLVDDAQIAALAVAKTRGHGVK